MIYIICTIHNANGSITSYYGFDTLADSTITLSISLLKNILINTKIHVVNASMQEDNIVIKEWPHGLASKHTTDYTYETEPKYIGPKCVLLSVQDTTYKTMSCEGYVDYSTEEAFKEIALTGQVANCTIVKGKNGDELIMTDVCKIKKDAEFAAKVKAKYDAFTAKTILLGYGKITFNYEIENHEVKLTEYTGSSRHVIIPPFITYISRGSFSGTGIESLQLCKGLKAIGMHSFRYNKLRQVTIPESVEIIGYDAFAFNANLSNKDNALRNDRFILRNAKTIVLTVYS